MRLADTLLTWLARISLILAAWTFLAFLAVAAWHCARQAGRRRAYQHAVQEVGEDTLDMLARAARDWPHESHAWGPASRERIATPFRHDCGCRLGSDLRGQPYWRPCEAHEREDGDFALWQAEMENQR